MAIANGTCISFCNQPNMTFWPLLGQSDWDNSGICHMDVKEDSMLVKCIAECTHLSSTIFQ